MDPGPGPRNAGSSRTIRGKRENQKEGEKMQNEAAALVTTNWLKWSTDPAQAYPLYRNAGISNASLLALHLTLHDSQQNAMSLPKSTHRRFSVTYGLHNLK